LTGISKTGLTASFVYDGLGRRKSKTINGTTTGFWYDGNDVYAELSSGTPSFVYIRGLNIDEPYIRNGTSDEFYQTDALGSSLVLTDGTGAGATSYTYEPFGTTTSSGTASTNALQYTGRENDGTNLYYYRARYYNPHLQRFISEDPIGFLGGDLNLYAYVSNRPLHYTDATGLFFTPDTILDAGFILYDIYELAMGGRKDRATNLAALGADIGGALTPGLTGLGLGVRAAKSAQTAVRTTRSGEKAVRITRTDGSVIDISPQRVKEYVPNTHPNAPPGTLDRVRFPDAQPGSKGLKRDPTPAEMEMLRNLP